MRGVRPLRIGTRESRLAVAQAELFRAALAGTSIELATELVTVRTRGDAISAENPHASFVDADGQFTGELERALRNRSIDVAVHSYKDLPTQSSSGMTIAAVLPRADARDCLITTDSTTLDELPPRAVIGTSSARRSAQLRTHRSDLITQPIRGNVETRISRVRHGEYDGVVLACAGLDRLDVPIPDGARLGFDRMLPAPAQGALAIQVRADRPDLLVLLAPLDHLPTRVAVDAERALLRAIGGGCLAPLGTLGEVADGRLRLRAVDVSDPDRPIRVDVEGDMEDSQAVVTAAAAGLRSGVMEGAR